MSKSHLTKLSLQALLWAPLAVACSTPPTACYTEPWVRPSLDVQNEIDANARRLPWTHGRERDELVKWFIKVGKPAFPALLKLSQDPRRDVAEAANNALCEANKKHCKKDDTRLVSALQALPWPGEEHIELQLERARALLLLGDRSMLPHIIGGLEHERLLIRSLCAQYLYDETGERFGYEPGESAAERARAIDCWNDWWAICSTPSMEFAQADVGP